MTVSDNGIPLSIFDYSFNEADGIQVYPYLSAHDILPSGTEINNECKLVTKIRKASVSDNAISPQFLSLPLESDVVTIDNIFQPPEPQMFAFEDKIMSPDFYHIFPFEDELITFDEASEQMGEPYHEENPKAINDICVPPTKDFLSCPETLNLEGAERLAVCADEVEEKGMELVQLLQECGEMIEEGKYDEAAELVRRCKSLSFQMGNATQRLGFYVSAALEERIELQTLRMKNSSAKPIRDFISNIDIEIDRNEFCDLLAYSNRALAYVKVIQFTSVQAIIDVVVNAENIHVIDLGMRTGSQWTVLMEYLAHRSLSPSLPALELLKITAVGMDGKELLKTGKRLHEVAESLAVPLSYNMVEIAGIKDIKEGFFTVESDEALAVYASFVLGNLLYDPFLLESLLIVFKKFRPRIMVHVEVEAQNNSPSFVNRFSKVVSFGFAYFDLLDVAFADRNDVKRVKHEDLIAGRPMRNMIVYEGKERTSRHVKTNVWRTLFILKGLWEMSFSFQAMYQATLLLEESGFREYYSLEVDGHAIIVKWKGTPLFGLSAWSGV